MSLVGTLLPIWNVRATVAIRGKADVFCSDGALPGLSSRPEESHPRALPDPCMNLSIHTAPDVRPLPWHSCQ
jgi:hypothetical protein